MVNLLVSYRQDDSFFATRQSFQAVSDFSCFRIAYSFELERGRKVAGKGVADFSHPA